MAILARGRVPDHHAQPEGGGRRARRDAARAASDRIERRAARLAALPRGLPQPRRDGLRAGRRPGGDAEMNRSPRGRSSSCSRRGAIGALRAPTPVAPCASPRRCGSCSSVRGWRSRRCCGVCRPSPAPGARGRARRWPSTPPSSRRCSSWAGSRRPGLLASGRLRRGLRPPGAAAARRTAHPRQRPRPGLLERPRATAKVALDRSAARGST